MLVATLVTFLYPGMTNYELIIPAIVVGTTLAWWSGKRVAMTDIPQMIALYNGMGGGAAAAIAAVELYRGGAAGVAISTLAVVGGIIGAVSFSGSAIAFGKLQGLIHGSLRFGGQKYPDAHRARRRARARRPGRRADQHLTGGRSPASSCWRSCSASA